MLLASIKAEAPKVAALLEGKPTGTNSERLRLIGALSVQCPGVFCLVLLPKRSFPSLSTPASTLERSGSADGAVTLGFALRRGMGGKHEFVEPSAPPLLEHSSAAAGVAVLSGSEHFVSPGGLLA